MGMAEDRLAHHRLLWRAAGRSTLIAVANLAASTAGFAAEIDTGIPDLKVRWDNTAKYSNAYRVMTPSSTLTTDVNFDDGDRNFKRGFVSNRVDLLSELDASYQNVGSRISVAGWYDSLYNRHTDNDSPGSSNRLSGSPDSFPGPTRTAMGRKVELLDAFVFGKGDVDDTQITARLGRHTIQWGETLFFGANGIAGGQAPVDLVKLLSVPSSQFKEILRPVNQLSGSVQISSRLSASAYLQFERRSTLLPLVGSFLSSADHVGNGAERLFVPGIAPNWYLARSSDMKSRNLGQGGVSVRYSPKDTDLDLGLYAIRYNAKTPQLYVIPGQGADIGSGGGKFGEYRQVYHEGIQAYGISASTNVGDFNVAAEISTRRNMDLVSDPVNIGCIGGGVCNPDANNRGNVAYAVGNTLHGNISAIYLLPPSSLWDGGNFLGEVAWNRVMAVTRNEAAVDPATTRDAVALRFLFEPTYFQVLPGLDVSVPIGFGYNPVGSSRAILAFNGGAEHGGDWSVGLKGTYRSVWNIGLSYTSFWGNAGSLVSPVNKVPMVSLSNKQTLADRDFLSLYVSRTF